MKAQQGNVPSWLLFCFFGSLLCGLVYGIFFHAFLEHNALHSLRTDSGALYVEPKLSIIPLRTKEAEQAGQGHYEKACVACHGLYGQYQAGLTGPDLFDQVWLHHRDEVEIGRLIMKGVDSSESITKQIMPARGGAILSDREVWEIIYYLSSKNPSVKKNAQATEEK